MTDGVEMLPLIEIPTEPHPCSYLPAERAALVYRLYERLTPAGFGSLLERGWRRHGEHFFRPGCPACRQCRSLRVPVARFAPTRSQRRCWSRNAGIDVEVRTPEVTPAHVDLYNRYHADMHARRGWPLQTIDAPQYATAFLGRVWAFAREMQYREAGRLVGVGLIDVTPGGLSSAYFYHDPAWRPRGPGVFSLLHEIEFARRHALPYVYLGYWIAACPSMAYKSQFGPNEVLSEYVADGEPANWRSEDLSGQASTRQAT